MPLAAAPSNDILSMGHTFTLKLRNVLVDLDAILDSRIVCFDLSDRALGALPADLKIRPSGESHAQGDRVAIERGDSRFDGIGRPKMSPLANHLIPSLAAATLALPRARWAHQRDEPPEVRA